MSKKLIFITNDDGVGARGLARLIEVLRPLGDLFVVAPEHAQSGMSHAITMNAPLFLRSVSSEPGLEIWACSGTPVDCIKMGLDHLLVGRRVDMVCSGINHGSNAAINVLYSGTMGAAIEGGFYDVPSIGFSLCDHSSDADFEDAGQVAFRIASGVFAGLEAGTVAVPLCLNVNVPVVSRGELRGVTVCRQCRGHWREEFFCRQNPFGRDYFWLTGSFRNAEPDAQDTDEWALAHGFVSVVPIQVDLTRHEQLGALGNLFGN